MVIVQSEKAAVVRTLAGPVPVAIHPAEDSLYVVVSSPNPSSTNVLRFDTGLQIELVPDSASADCGAAVAWSNSCPAGLTQAEIASRMGTTQSVVARLETARHMPSFDLVARYAAAIDRRLDIHLVLSGSGRTASVQA